MIMPIDIDKKEFSRDKRGYNSREVDEFLDLIIADYEKVLNDNRSMAHKIKFLEKQLEDAQKSDSAMLETLETAKRLMADISASAERRAELMMRDAELEAENMISEAKATVHNLNQEHLVLKQKVERLRKGYASMLREEMDRLNEDVYGLLPDLDRSDIPDVDKVFGGKKEESESNASAHATLVINKDDAPAPEQAPQKSEPFLEQATVSDLSASLKSLANDNSTLEDTIILK